MMAKLDKGHFADYFLKLQTMALPLVSFMPKGLVYWRNNFFYLVNEKQHHFCEFVPQIDCFTFYGQMLY